MRCYGKSRSYLRHGKWTEDDCNSGKGKRWHRDHGFKRVHARWGQKVRGLKKRARQLGRREAQRQQDHG
jgi:hypothetical protein